MGVPGLSAFNQTKDDVGNATAAAGLDIAEAADRAGHIWIIENPHSSRLWLHPRMKRLMDRPSTMQVVTDYCQWGQPWRKRTRLLIGNACAEDLIKLERRCTGRGICSRTGRPHAHLEGSTNGVRRTLIAMTYPERFAHAIASILLSKVAFVF